MRRSTADLGYCTTKKNCDTTEQRKAPHNCSLVQHVPKDSYHMDGFGGLVVSMLASGTQLCGFKPGRSRWIFRT